MYVQMYMVYVCLYTYANVYEYMCMYIHTQTRMHACSRTSMNCCVLTFICSDIHTHILYTYIHPRQHLQ